MFELAVWSTALAVLYWLFALSQRWMRVPPDYYGWTFIFALVLAMLAVLFWLVVFFKHVT